MAVKPLAAALHFWAIKEAISLDYFCCCCSWLWVANCFKPLSGWHGWNVWVILSWFLWRRPRKPYCRWLFMANVVFVNGLLGMISPGVCVCVKTRKRNGSGVRVFESSRRVDGELKVFQQFLWMFEITEVTIKDTSLSLCLFFQPLLFLLSSFFGRVLLLEWVACVLSLASG